MSLVVVGSFGIDTIETPFDSRAKALGGSATYISLAASYFSRDTIALVGVVGEDFPDHGWQLFRDRNFDLDGVEVVKGGKTFAWHGRYHYDMNNRDSLATNLNVLADFKPVLPSQHRSPNFLVLGNIDPALQLDVIEQLAERPKLVLMDTMDFWINGKRDDLIKALRRSDALILNDSEARLLADHPSLIVCGRRLQGMLGESGPRIVVIKKGEHGAMLFYQENLFAAPAYPLEDIYDPTGAGDTFLGGFIGYLSKMNSTAYEDVKRAVIFGTILASHCCSKFSTEGIEKLSTNEIFERFAELRTLVMFEEHVEPAQSYEAALG